jgi:hypothetical protein
LFVYKNIIQEAQNKINKISSFFPPINTDHVA